MKTDWIDGELSQCDFPEAFDAIEKVFLTIPDACEERYIQLVDEYFNLLNWEPASSGWVIGIFLFAVVLLYAIPGELFVINILGRHMEVFDTSSDLFINFYGVGMVALAGVVTGLMVKRMNRTSWERQTSRRSWRGEEYLVLEAAYRARDELFEEIGRRE